MNGPRGLTILLTGLSGAGKTTIATTLVERLATQESRPIHLLDGDTLRQEMSADLTFSKVDRCIHIERIGRLARDKTSRGGIVVCALIAPYDDARRQMRASVSAVGDFRLVYVSTPLEVCEQRDVKGLYALARTGALAQFTGLSDPYEPPGDADVVVNTASASVDDSVSHVLKGLAATGVLAAPERSR